MARIRTIKPEFPQSETIGRLSRDARLLFIQLWTLVDDEGRTRAASRMLASLLYPYDDDARDLLNGWLDELEREGCVRRYTADDSQYLEICNWLKHQKIDHPSKSKLPGPPLLLSKPREDSRSLAPDLDLGPSTNDLGEERKETRACALRRPDWPIDYQKQFWDQYPNKVGKPKAFSALDRLSSRRDGPPFAELMAGLLRYTAKTDERPWCNPATWLNQERWADQPATFNGSRNGDGHKQHPSKRAFELADQLDAALEREAGAVRNPTGGGENAVSLLEWRRST